MAFVVIRLIYVGFTVGRKKNTGEIMEWCHYMKGVAYTTVRLFIR